MVGLLLWRAAAAAAVLLAVEEDRGLARFCAGWYCCFCAADMLLCFAPMVILFSKKAGWNLRFSDM